MYIEDMPLVAHRSLMVDCAREHLSLAFHLSTIKKLSSMKMSVRPPVAAKDRFNQYVDSHFAACTVNAWVLAEAGVSNVGIPSPPVG